MRRRLRIGAVIVAVFIVLTPAGAVVWTRLGPDPSADARAVAGSAVATGDGTAGVSDDEARAAIVEASGRLVSRVADHAH